MRNATTPMRGGTRARRPGALLLALSMLALTACNDVTDPSLTFGGGDDQDEDVDDEDTDDPAPDATEPQPEDEGTGPDEDDPTGPDEDATDAPDEDATDAPDDDAPMDDTDDEDDPERDGSAAGELEVHFLDVGQADATLLHHDEVTVLIETGHWQRSDVIDHLDELGVEALDLVVVTHPHADHIGQFDQVLETYEVDEVWWSGSETTTQTFDRALSALEASDAAYEEPRSGDTTTVGPLEVEVVNPPEGVDLGDLHDANLAMRITFGGFRLLFTGDAESATEARMVDDAGDTLRADVLQLGHHGSDTSTTQDLLDAVGPELAVYSAGADNTYGHPHAEVLDRLDAAGVTVHGTPEDGTVVVTSDGSSWSVSTERDGER